MGKILLLGAGASYSHGVQNELTPPMASRFFSHPAYMQVANDYHSVVEYVKRVLLLDLDDPTEADVEFIMGRMEPSWRMHIYDNLQMEEVDKLLGAPFGYISPID